MALPLRGAVPSVAACHVIRHTCDAELMLCAECLGHGACSARRIAARSVRRATCLPLHAPRHALTSGSSVCCAAVDASTRDYAVLALADRLRLALRKKELANAHFAKVSDARRQ